MRKVLTTYADIFKCNWDQPGPLFQKVISENRIRSGLREVADSFYENLTAITERERNAVGSLS